jgi:uncharacterized protein involved in exopolysaccharide biosynthesis
MAETTETADCAALRTTIDSLQKEFEGLWIQVSSGGTPTPRFRELRREIDQLRARYASECGTPSEESSLPPHMMSDWRAG